MTQRSPDSVDKSSHLLPKISKCLCLPEWKCISVDKSWRVTSLPLWSSDLFVFVYLCICVFVSDDKSWRDTSRSGRLTRYSPLRLSGQDMISNAEQCVPYKWSRWQESENGTRQMYVLVNDKPLTLSHLVTRRVLRAFYTLLCFPSLPQCPLVEKSIAPLCDCTCHFISMLSGAPTIHTSPGYYGNKRPPGINLS